MTRVAQETGRRRKPVFAVALGPGARQRRGQGMAKTRRELLLAIAEKVGGERGRQMRDAVKRCYHANLDREISEDEFAATLAQAERDLPTVLAHAEAIFPEPGTWGFPN